MCARGRDERSVVEEPRRIDAESRIPRQTPQNAGWAPSVSGDREECLGRAAVERRDNQFGAVKGEERASERFACARGAMLALARR